MKKVNVIGYALLEFFQIQSKIKYLIGFLFVFCCAYFILLSYGPVVWVYDSGLYYDLGNSYYNENGFSILNFNAAYRGYSYPLLLNVIRFISQGTGCSETIVFELFSALLFSFFSCIIVPEFIEKLFKGTLVKLGQILLYASIFLFFWADTMAYPLTDIPSVYFMLFSVSLLLSRNVFWFILSGVFAGLAINFRPIYAIALLPILFYVWYAGFDKTQIKRKLLGTFFILAGVFIISLPQILINKKWHATYSPMVQTSGVYEGGLYFQQLKIGMGAEKYETNIGTAYPKPQVYFVSKTGNAIAVKEPISNYSDYFKLYLKYPVEFAYMNFKHLFNSIDIKDSCVYTKNIYKRRYLFSLINYSVFFLFFCILIYENIKCRKNLIFLSLIFLLPFMAILPTQVEVRFSFPFLIIVYLTVGFYGGYKDLLKQFFGPRKRRILLAWFFFVSICFILSQSTYAMLEFDKQL